MILNVYSDALYLSESEAHSHTCGHFFMGWSPNDSDSIRLNCIFFMLCTILRFIVSSTAEAELGALFLNCKEGMIFCLTLGELGHLQPKHMSIVTTPQWLVLQIIQSSGNAPVQCRCVIFGYAIRWHKEHMQSDGTRGRKILQIIRANIMLGLTIGLFAPGTYTTMIHLWYVLPRATRPSTLKGCVGTHLAGLVHNVPLPWVPLCQSTQSHQLDTIPDYYEIPYAVPTYNTPCSLVESTAYAFSPAWQAIAINT
jgi:hypothetical protein